MVKLRDRVVQVSITIFLLTFAICLLVILQVGARIGNEWEGKNRSTIDLVSDQIEEAIVLPLKFLEEVDNLILSAEDLKSNQVTRYLQTLKKAYDYFEEIQVVDLNGYVVNTDTGEDTYIGKNLSGEPFYNEAQIGHIYVSPIYKSSVTDLPTLTIIQGMETYSLIVRVNLKGISEYFGSEKYYKDVNTIHILDQEGKYIVGKVDEHNLYGQMYENYDLLRMSSEKTGYIPEINVGFSRIDSLNIYVVFEFDPIPLYGNLVKGGLILIISFIILAVFGWYNLYHYSHEINKQIEILMERAKSHVDGLTIEDDMTEDFFFEEIVELYRDFEDKYAIALERENKVLKLNEELENQVFERTRELEEANDQLKREIKERENTEQEIQHMYMNLDKQVQSRTEELEFLNTVLKTSVKEAEEANNAKSKFLSVMSHEMRTPLNGIIGFIQMLELEPMNESQEEIVSIIKNSSRTLLNLINEILDLAKYESGKMAFEEVTFNLGKVIEDSVVPFKTMMNYNANIQFTDTYEGVLDVRVKGDPIKLTQLFTNLISNAVKFTEKGYIKVRVQAFTNGSKLKLLTEIKDSGIGIKEEVRQYLFTPFYQADASITREFGGTGLGLTICKEIVDHYDGIIEVDSVESRGSIFRFSFTYDMATEEAEEFLTNNQEDGAKRIIGRILVVEDNMVNQKLMDKFLNKHGVNHDIASNGKEAVELCKINKYEMIFMDCQMPIMDGFDATRTIRANGFKGSIYAMTAYASNNDRKKALESGMDEFLSKPVDLNLVRSILGIQKKKKTEAEIVDTEVNEYLDITVKSLMKKIDFDYDTCMDLIITYIQQANEAFINLERQLESKDYKGVAKKLHQMKGAAGAVRFDRMRRDFEEAEELIKEGDIEKCMLIIDKLKKNPLLALEV